MKLNKILKIILIINLVLIILDQTSKILINNFVKSDIKIIPNEVFTITKLENEGIAFGLNKQNLGNILLSLIVLVFVFNYIISQKERMKMSVIVFLSFIIAGGISNVIDRIFKGAVFDFIKIGNFPVFNLADVFIVGGWILFVVNFIKETTIDIKSSSVHNKIERK